MLKDICLEGNRMNSSLILSILKPGFLFVLFRVFFVCFQKAVLTLLDQVRESILICFPDLIWIKTMMMSSGKILFTLNGLEKYSPGVRK